MKIHDILLNLDIPSKEIKIRFKNGQIKLNNQVLKDSIDLDIEDFIMEIGDFITNFYDEKQLKTLKTWILISNDKIGELFGESSNIQILDNLEAFHCLTTSKNEHYILMKK